MKQITEGLCSDRPGRLFYDTVFSVGNLFLSYLRLYGLATLSDLVILPTLLEIQSLRFAAV